MEIAIRPSRLLLDLFRSVSAFFPAERTQADQLAEFTELTPTQHRSSTPILPAQNVKEFSGKKTNTDVKGNFLLKRKI
jgi:hypothetical protein